MKAKLVSKIKCLRKTNTEITNKKVLKKNKEEDNKFNKLFFLITGQHIHPDVTL